MKKIFLSLCMLLSLVMNDVSANQCPKALNFEIKRLGEDKVENLDIESVSFIVNIMNNLKNNAMNTFI